tara:strand:- start:6674 stop:7393 length:720 start_codon:yes stop_codon:yes gene_type:complete
MPYHYTSNTNRTPQSSTQRVQRAPANRAVARGVSYTRENVLSAEGEKAPPGFHYMPDGTLMSDADHMEQFGNHHSGCNEYSSFKLLAKSSLLKTWWNVVTNNKKDDNGDEVVNKVVNNNLTLTNQFNKFISDSWNGYQASANKHGGLDSSDGCDYYYEKINDWQGGKNKLNEIKVRHAGSSAHYLWWEYDSKINWANEMMSNCSCGPIKDAAVLQPVRTKEQSRISKYNYRKYKRNNRI